jgi:hypothetical protein
MSASFPATAAWLETARGLSKTLRANANAISAKPGRNSACANPANGRHWRHN